MHVPLIAVFGATGRLGGGLARAILADPRRRLRVRAVTRRPAGPAAHALAQAGAEVTGADLDHPRSVLAAMRGAQGAFCVTPCPGTSCRGDDLARARTLAEAAKQAGVAHVVWATCEDTREFVAGGGLPALADGRFVPSLDGKGEANVAFIERDLPCTLFYPAFPWEDLVRLGLDARAAADGVRRLRLPFGRARFAGIAAEDIGACAYGLFAAGAEMVGKAIGVAGEHLTGEQLAEQLTLALGESVVHAPATRDEWAMRDTPCAAEMANLFQFRHDFAHACLALRSVACARALHPATMSFAAWLARQRAWRPIGVAAA